MQIYTETIKYQMRKQAVGHSDENFKGVIRKTGIFTLFGVLLTLVNLILNILFPDKSKNQNYFLSQDLISCFATGVILPMVIAKTNPAMSKFFQLRLSSNNGEYNEEKLWIQVLNIFVSLFSRKETQIHPIV
jgi:hypothetical protein